VDIFGTVEAFAVLGRLSRPLLDVARSAVLHRVTCEEHVSKPTTGPRIASAAMHLSSQRPETLIAQASICALWKPPGWTVSVVRDEDSSIQGHNVQMGTHTSGELDGSGEQALESWIQKRHGQFPISTDASVAHGLLHRLDRDTSGVILWAHTYHVYYLARLQFAAHALQKHYVCLCHGPVQIAKASLTSPLADHTFANGSVGSIVTPTGRRAHTQIHHVGHVVSPEGCLLSLVKVQLYTGRRHQIRVHLSDKGHPLVADRLYGNKETYWCRRIFLHAYRVSIDIGDGALNVTVALPSDLRQVLHHLAG